MSSRSVPRRGMRLLWLSLLAYSVLFALLPSLVWCGLVYGWAALRYGLRLSIVLHILNNSVAVALPLLRGLGTPGALALFREPLLWAVLLFDGVYLVTESFTRL